VYFNASGRETGEDPYLRHLYRVNLDGSDLQLLTPEAADHEISFANSGRYFIDSYSRADLPTVSLLRSADGNVIRELARADVTKLAASGWKPPEPFRATAADGVTEICGLMFRPANFDPGKKYPVLDAIYPGPQTIKTPKNFPATLAGDGQDMAQLGFVVVTVDGRGTPFRSKAFHDFSYGKLGTAGGLEDHIAALRQLAKVHAYMDLDRVGIYGHSGGGYATVRAMLTYPEFYKVGVASAGNHDMRGYLARWGEKYIGPVNGDNYLEAANPVLAANLKGKLLLAWGDMDDNVPPSLSMQLVSALIKANKTFDMLVLPNRNHSFFNDPYFIRRRWDYLVEHLAGAMPPEYKLRTSSPQYRTLDLP
jgi:dipeptidyl aminopeptidase/acylaminoacyl peptidase